MFFGLRLLIHDLYALILYKDLDFDRVLTFNLRWFSFILILIIWRSELMH